MGRRAIKAENGQGSVYKRKDVRSRPWVAVAPAVRSGMGYKRLVVGTFRTAQEAKDALEQWRRSPTDKFNVTLSELHDEWMSVAYRDISRQTKDCYNAAWKKLTPLHNVKFRELRTAQMQAIIDEVSLTKSLSTVKKIKVVLTSMYSYAMQNDIVSKNYAEFIKITDAESTQKPENVFYDTEIEVLRRDADAGNDISAAIMLMIYTGFRISEFLALTPFSYSSTDHTLIGGNKTDAGRNRTVPVHPSAQPYLDRWLAKGGATIICTDFGKAMRPERFRQLFYDRLDALKLRRVTPHATRHTFSTLLAAAGARPEVLTAIIGHEDYSTDVNTYLHPSLDTLTEAVRKIR